MILAVIIEFLVDLSLYPFNSRRHFKILYLDHPKIFRADHKDLIQLHLGGQRFTVTDNIFNLNLDWQ